MTLLDAMEGEEYTVGEIQTEDEDWNAFLFSLGCLPGEAITVVSKKRSGYTVCIKDGRYNMDAQLAQSIVLA